MGHTTDTRLISMLNTARFMMTMKVIPGMSGSIFTEAIYHANMIKFSLLKPWCRFVCALSVTINKQKERKNRVNYNVTRICIISKISM